MLGVNRFDDLDVYKLAVRLRREVVRLTSSGAVARDYKFVDQIRDAARGGPRNIAEGFSRFAPSEFCQFLSYAKASIDETKNHVDDGHDSGYFSDEEYDVFLSLIRRTRAGINRLMAYLRSPDAARAYQELRKRHRQRPYVRRQTDKGANKQPNNVRNEGVGRNPREPEEPEEPEEP